MIPRASTNRRYGRWFKNIEKHLSATESVYFSEKVQYFNARHSAVGAGECLRFRLKSLTVLLPYELALADGKHFVAMLMFRASVL